MGENKRWLILKVRRTETDKASEETLLHIAILLECHVLYDRW